MRMKGNPSVLLFVLINMQLEHNWTGKTGKLFVAVLPLLFLFQITIFKIVYSFLIGHLL